MNLRSLTTGLSSLEHLGPEATEITDLTYDSRQVRPGSLFFCVNGFKVDGHEFAAQAVEQGATAIVCERELELDVAQLVVADVRPLMAAIAKRFFGDPVKQLRLVGITGTNGKTTTAFLMRTLFEAAGERCGLLGTVEQIVGGRSESVERTTPEAVDLFRLFRRMVDAGDTACVMEVSSHALALHRCSGVKFECAIFTNLTQDHLDFHGTMEEYFQSKRQLFFPSKGGPPKIAVVNYEDQSEGEGQFGWRLADELRAAGQRVVTYSSHDTRADYWADEVEPPLRGTRFRVNHCNGEGFVVETPLVGRFNVENVLAAVAACSELSLDVDIAAAMKNTPQVPGRFECIDEGQGFTVLVDYAHTPDALENALRGASHISRHRVIVVFGCGGDRDKRKRPLMGKIAVENADIVIVTSDNSRSEDPEQIIKEILVGADEALTRTPVKKIVEQHPSREAAIKRALEMACDLDVVLIAGKGHEQYQEQDGKKVYFDDRQVAREMLRKQMQGAQ